MRKKTPAAEELLLAAEHQLGRRLPEKFRARLLRENGGEVRARGEAWTLYPVFDPSDAQSAKRTAGHLVQATEMAREWRGFPQGAVAIAENGDGDYLVLRGAEVDLWDSHSGETIPVAVWWG
ncbi:MAG: SMI1/KNR4 family protein [Myxococcales bacterium]|nr:SMI1/KNR4 family protein [Myxococcales bacterium]